MYFMLVLSKNSAVFLHLQIRFFATIGLSYKL